MLENYYTTPLEEWVNSVYESVGVYSPDQIDESDIAEGLDVFYSKVEENSSYLVTDFIHMVMIDKRLPPEEHREQFFHELCHVLRHAGRQTMMPAAFRELQEAQTKNFLLYAALPFPMIKTLELPNHENEIIALFSSVFQVTTTLAKERLDQIKRRLLQSKLSYEYQAAVQRNLKVADPANWSYETKAILQLAVERKIAKEGVLAR